MSDVFVCRREYIYGYLIAATIAAAAAGVAGPGPAAAAAPTSSEKGRIEFFFHLNRIKYIKKSGKGKNFSENFRILNFFFI